MPTTQTALIGDAFRTAFEARVKADRLYLDALTILAKTHRVEAVKFTEANANIASSETVLAGLSFSIADYSASDNSPVFMSESEAAIEKFAIAGGV